MGCRLRPGKERPTGASEELVEKGFLSPEQAKAVDLRKIRRFLKGTCSAHPFGGKAAARVPLYCPFGGGELNPELPADLGQEKVVLQGAVDCAFVEDSALVVVDYKTDHTKSGGGACEKVRPQLALTAAPLRNAPNTASRECLLYSFELGEAVPRVDRKGVQRARLSAGGRCSPLHLFRKPCVGVHSVRPLPMGMVSRRFLPKKCRFVKHIGQ